MNRLSWDTTAPRRLAAKQPAPKFRPADDDVVTESAELTRGAWDRPHRIGPFA